MASFRIIAALMVVSGACVVAGLPASAQTVRAAAAPITIPGAHGFARCPKTADQYANVMKQLASSVARARALADENPLLEPDAAFYEAELAATRSCAGAVATLAGR